MPREQGESGEFVETIAPEDVLDVFDAVDGPVILSADVADHFGVTRETARRKLKQLSDRGELDRRKVSRRVIYWRADGDGFDAGGLRGDPSTTLDDTDAEHTATTASGTDPTETTGDARNAESGRTRAESDAVDPVDHDELPDGVDVADAREAYDAVRSHLREDGPAGKRSIVAAVMVEYPPGRYRGAWWRRVIRPALAADPDVTHRENHGDYDL